MNESRSRLGMFFNRMLRQMDIRRRRDAPDPAPAAERRPMAAIFILVVLITVGV